ncbi:hypothetical protein MUB04_14375 [Acinetobacter indicus]|uniref:hypothetical protein n=1 Tax=Acinetobacter TaxID=469 RepID=UPI0015D44DF0|nr:MULTISPECIES: hypothetical protein [Acinetobacter]MCP0917717.1 hypothetical protein [Acinetobacter indicus]
MTSNNEANQPFVKFVDNFSTKFKRISGFAKWFNITLLVGFIAVYLGLQIAGEVYSTTDLVMWSLLLASLLFYTLCYHLYKKHTKKLTKRLYEEQMDIRKYNFKFLEQQHQITILNTLQFNLYLANFLFITLLLSVAQCWLTVVAIVQWSSTTNYLVAFICGFFTFIAMGFPFAYNILTKLSHIYLIRSNDSEIKLIGKPIAFTGIGEISPKIIAPRYYQVIQETISTSRHANYVIQLIKVIDHSKNRYEYSVIKIDYLSEIKNHIHSETDYEYVVSALRKNGFAI